MCFTSSKSYKLLPLRYRKATVRNTKADKSRVLRGVAWDVLDLVKD